MVTSEANAQHGISAVLLAPEHLDHAVLDLTAVLEGLVSKRFEIIIVAGHAEEAQVDELRARAPGLPLRVVLGETMAIGCDAATYSLIFVSAPDGQFDVRELNHLLEEIEKGADVATGYRPHRTDRIFRRLQRWGWPVDLDCACNLFRRRIWQAWRRQSGRLKRKFSCGDFLTNVRRLGYRVVEVPVRRRRPTLGTALYRAA